MSTNDTHWNGARWWKIDFHTHTPASNDYGKGPDQAALQERSPSTWLLDYMRAGIDCVVVTDHNSGSWIDRLKAALDALKKEKPEGYRPLVLFPGVEISVSGGIHLLAVLEPSKSTADVHALLGACGFPTQNLGTSDSVTRKSFEEVVAQVVNAGGIAIPAHVSAPKGMFTVLSGITLAQALAMPGVIAMESTDPTWQPPAAYAQHNTHWTEVAGTDAHHPSGAPGTNFPGSRFTWVKMGTPGIEGLRLALRDGLLSVRRSNVETTSPDNHAQAVIESIRITGTCYMGRPVALDIALNPWLNAIVGGRGTGKSSIVEFLRWAMGRETELPQALTTEYAKYFAVSTTRGDGNLQTPVTRVEVIYLKDGARFRISRNANGGASATVEGEGQGGWQLSPGNVLQRFPIRIYSQKQIFQLAKESSALLQVVDDAPQVGYQDWREQQDTLENRYLSLRAQIRELSASIGREADLNGNLEDLKRKLLLFEQSEHATVLAAYQTRSRQQEAANAWTAAWSGFGDRLRAAIAGATPPSFPPPNFGAGPEEEALGSEARAISEQASALVESAIEVAKRADALEAAWRATVTKSAWKARADAAIQAHATLRATLKAEGADAPDAYAELVTRRQKIERELAEISSLRTKIEKMKADATGALTECRAHREQLTNARRQFLAQVLGGNAYVRIEVEPYQARDAAEVQLRELLQRGQGGFEKDIGLPGGDGLLGNLYQRVDQSKTPFETRLATIKRSVRDIFDGAHNPDDLADLRFAAHIQKLPPEALDRLDLWFPEDALAVSYTPAGTSKFRPISEGSPGQKTAALLAFLLSYGREPLVLDQPEDDLDNRLIYDLIVKQLRSVKLTRQVIVATHNSNIVVNGDAELVVALASHGGQTQKDCEGCLQQLEVRNVICKIMEGGREAFEERYRRIALESATQP